MEEFRGFKKSYGIMAVSYIVFGLVLLIWPDISLKTFCYILGIGAIIFGIVHIIVYFTRDRIMSMIQMDLVLGIIGAALGIFVLVKPEFVVSILPFAVGVLLMLGAVVKFQNSLDLKKLEFQGWWVLLLLCIALLALGIVLILDPFGAASVLVMLIGMGLAADGVISLWSMLTIYYRLRKLNKEIGNSSEEVLPEIVQNGKE